MSWDWARLELARATHDLRSETENLQNALIEAKKDVAIAIMGGQSYSTIGSSILTDYNVKISLSDMDQYDRFKPATVPVVPKQVYRRTIGLPVLSFYGQPTTSHGPFKDLFERQVYLDVYQPIPAVEHQFVIGNPFLYIAAPITSTVMFQQVLGPGKVWIRAEWFTRQADQNERASSSNYFALDFVSGVMGFPPMTPPMRSLTLKLDETKAASNLFGIKPFSDVTFQFYHTSNVAKISKLGDSQISILGATYNLSKGDDIGTSRGMTLDFKLQINQTILQPDSVSSLMDIRGACSIAKAAWSLPLQRVTEKRFFAPQPPMVLLELKPGLTLDVKGETHPLALEECTVRLTSDQLIITGSRGRRINESSQHILFGGSNKNTQATLGSVYMKSPSVRESNKKSGEVIFGYIATNSGSESWTMNLDLYFALNQPRTVNNERVRMESITFSDNRRNRVSWILNGQSENVSMRVDAATMEPRLVSYALKNALLKAEVPRLIEVYGEYERGTITLGEVKTLSYLRYAVPTLPDPYITNFSIGVDAEAEKAGLGHILMSTSWKTDTSSSLDVKLFSPKYTEARVIDRSNSGIGGRLPDDPAFRGAAFYDENIIKEKELDNGLIPDVGWGQLFHTQKQQTRGSYWHPPTLVDVSSNQSQFGVIFATQSPNLNATGTSDTWQSPLTAQFHQEEFYIKDLMVHGTTKNVRIMALPATQWEPLITENKGRYNFTYSGPSTQIALNQKTPTVTLVPISPAGAIDGLLKAYNGLELVTLATRLSLPFGMIGMAVMPNKMRLIPSAKVNKIDFTFASQDSTIPVNSTRLNPQDQLSFIAPPKLLFRVGGGMTLSPNSPSFSGVTTLVKFRPEGASEVENGQQDIFGVAAKAFLSDMANQVPLTRFDVSGYGASIFSDWRQIDAKDPAISKVALDILNGRTSRQVIVLDSVMAPFAVKVKQTTEIKRLNNGMVVRHTENWQATSEGHYNYQNPDIVTHMGVIRGVSDVRNIRAIGEITIPNTQIKVVPTKFDCIVEIEDGGKVRNVPTINLEGCIFLGNGDLNAPHGKDNYAKVLQTMELGGKFDTTIQIGTSGQRKRISSLSVKSTTSVPTSQQTAVAAAWGAPIFEGGGQWSFAKIANDGLPQLVDSAKGVPLVREMLHNIRDPRTVTSPFQFKDPEQLLNGAPDVIYGIVHGAGSHRVLFANPHIPSIDGLKEIISDEVLLADSFALGKATGVFPALKDCLPILPDVDNYVKQALQILDGGYAFEPRKVVGGVLQGTNLDLPDLERTLSDDASVKTVVSSIRTIRDEAGNVRQASEDLKSSVNLAINTAKNISKMNITNINLITSTVSSTTKEASRLVGRLNSDANNIGGLLGKDINLPDLPDADPAKLLASPIHTFGPALQQVQKVVSFLENLKFLPHFKISMTNEWSMTMSTSMNREDLLKKLPAPSRPAVEKFIESFDFSLSSRTSFSSFLLTLHVGTTIKIPTGFPPIVALAKGAFDVALGTSGVEIKLDLGFGVGVDFSLGPFHVSASYTQSQTIIFHTDHWGIGITACMRAHIDLVVASADLYLEASLLVVGGECKEEIHNNKSDKHDQTTIWGFAQVRVAVHISIFLICNISVDEEAHWENNFNGGPCKLEYMSDLPK